MRQTERGRSQQLTKYLQLLISNCISEDTFVKKKVCQIFLFLFSVRGNLKESFVQLLIIVILI